MTHGTIAGILLTDLIMGRTNEWENLYEPSRISLRAAPEFALTGTPAVSCTSASLSALISAAL